NIVIMRAFEHMAKEIEEVIKSNLNFEETYEAITRMKISQLEKYSSIFLENLMTQYTHDPEFFDNDAINAQMEIYNEHFEKGQSDSKIDSNLTIYDFMVVINIFVEGMTSLYADTLYKRTDSITRFFVNGLKG